MQLSITSMAIAQENEKVIAPKVKEVTLFLNGAEVRHLENIELKKGRNSIIVEGLSSSLDKNSVQVTVGDQVELVSVSTNEVSLSPAKIDKRIKTLQDSINILQEKLELTLNQIDAYEFEKATLTANQSIGGSQTGVSLAELNKVADFFRERTIKINNTLSELKRRSRNQQQQLDSFKGELTHRLSKINTSRKQITIVVYATSSLKSNFTIRYAVSDASWSASYDLIAADNKKSVRLKYKAKLYNNTSINWEDVALTLSTGDPSASATRPSLSPWILNYNSNANEGKVENKTYTKQATRDSTSAYEDVAVDELSTSFTIDKPYTVYGDGCPLIIEVSENTLPASFEYHTIPKVDLSAFLIAKVTGWEKLHLIDGNANVYFRNTYMGESSIDSRIMGDTLELSLGRDNQILVSRSKLEDKASKKLIGTKQSESFTYELQVNNNRKTPITIRVIDQVPVSQDSDISVDIENISGAAHENLSGKLQWIKDLQPGESVKYLVSFTVKYPKGKRLYLRKKRIIRSPRFRHE